LHSSNACLNCPLFTMSVNSSTKEDGIAKPGRKSIARRTMSVTMQIDTRARSGPKNQPADSIKCIGRLRGWVSAAFSSALGSPPSWASAGRGVAATRPNARTKARVSKTRERVRLGRTRRPMVKSLETWLCAAKVARCHPKAAQTCGMVPLGAIVLSIMEPGLQSCQGFLHAKPMCCRRTGVLILRTALHSAEF
jgi:hypothetical protein